MRSCPDPLALCSFAVALSGVVGCQGESTDTADSDSTTAAECDETYSWISGGAPFIYTWCTACHSSSIEAGTDTGWDPRQGAPESGLALWVVGQSDVAYP